MVIDCGTCSLRNVGCGDCVVTALTDAAKAGTSSYDEICMGSARFELGADECAAIEVLADAGLSPRLRLLSGRQKKSAGDGVAEPSRRRAG